MMFSRKWNTSPIHGRIIMESASTRLKSMEHQKIYQTETWSIDMFRKKKSTFDGWIHWSWSMDIPKKDPRQIRHRIVPPLEAGPDGISLGDCPFSHSVQMALGGGSSTGDDGWRCPIWLPHKRDGFYILEIPKSKMDDMGICMIGLIG